MTTRDILLKAYKKATDKNIEFANYMVHKETTKAASVQRDLYKLNTDFGKLLKNSIIGLEAFENKMTLKVSEDNNRCNKSNLIKMHQNEEDSHKIIGCFKDISEWGVEIINEAFDDYL